MEWIQQAEFHPGPGKLSWTLTVRSWRAQLANICNALLFFSQLLFPRINPTRFMPLDRLYFRTCFLQAWVAMEFSCLHSHIDTVNDNQLCQCIMSEGQQLISVCQWTEPLQDMKHSPSVTLSIRQCAVSFSVACMFVQWTARWCCAQAGALTPHTESWCVACQDNLTESESLNMRDDWTRGTGQQKISQVQTSQAPCSCSTWIHTTQSVTKLFQYQYCLHSNTHKLNTVCYMHSVQTQQANAGVHTAVCWCLCKCSLCTHSISWHEKS